MITDCRDLWPQIVSRPAGHFDGRLTPYRWSLPSWWSRCCCCRTTTGQPHLRHPKCAAWSPYIFILLTTTLITVHEVSKRFKKWPVPVPKSPGAAADCYHEQTKNMSIDTRYPAAHVSLPLAPPTAATGHSIQTAITPALFKRSRPLQPSLASSAHLRAAPQCSKQQHQVTFIWIILHLIVDYFCDLGNYKLCWEMINEQK